VSPEVGPNRDESFQPVQHPREVEICCFGIRTHVSTVTTTGNGGGEALLVKDPSDRDLCKSRAKFGCDGSNPVSDGETALGLTWGEQPLVERTVQPRAGPDCPDLLNVFPVRIPLARGVHR